MPSTRIDASPTVRALLEREGLSLRLIGAENDLPHGALDRTLRWVHSTDLSDPTPFLAEDLLLLTTGRQLTEGTDTEAHDYVERLTGRGVAALGFGTEVVRDGVPPALAAACAAAGLPLFEVPYRTPFIAVARANAEAVAAQAYARRSWALAAQRAISLAALRPDGLRATVAELAKQLDTWVGLYDAAGNLSHEYPAHGVADSARIALAGSVATVLRRGSQAASAEVHDEQPFTLQTLGRGGHLRGVIAIAATELDQEGRSVLTSVIAMTGLALEQHRSLGRARAALRGGLIDALFAGNVSLVRRVARASGDALPAGPVVIAVADEPGGRSDAMTEWLELQASERRGALFFGSGNDELVMLLSPDAADLLDQFAERFAVTVGTSGAVEYGDASDAIARARIARGRGLGGVTTFADTHASGVFGTLTDESRLVADSMLAPLRRTDATDGTRLTETLHAYLEHNGSAEATADALGVHRHTVRARIRAAEQALGLRLDSFPVRAELWAAFLASAPVSARLV